MAATPRHRRAAASRHDRAGGPAALGRSIAAGATALARPVGAGAAALILAGCADVSRVLVGPVRPPTAASEVRVLFEPPRGSFVVIARLESSSRHSFALTALGKEDVVIERLRREAARVGANALLLEELGEHPLEAIDASAGAGRQGPRGTIDVGLGGVMQWVQKFGRGLAIHLDSSDACAPPQE